MIGELQNRPTPPWGIGGREPTVAVESLEPGDSVMLYTDGVTEARTADGKEFGIEQLIDLTDRHASEMAKPDVMLRTLVAHVRAYQGGEDLSDDATLVLVRWDGVPDH